MPISRFKSDAQQIFSGTLPAVGAYHSVSSSVIQCGEYNHGTILMHYQLGADGGYPAAKVYGSVDGTNYYCQQEPVLTYTTTTSGSVFQCFPFVFCFSPETAYSSVELSLDAWKYVRVEFAESGSIDNPGYVIASLVPFNK